ncbi:hypothetical protein VP01_8555g1, partial [Puccinia sorghi]
MDPWNHQYNTFVPSAQSSTEGQENAHATALAHTSQLESMIASLAEEVCSLKASSNPLPTKTKKNQPCQPKTATRSQNLNQVLSSPAATSTPKRQIRANSAPPEVGNSKPRKLVKSPRASKLSRPHLHNDLPLGNKRDESISGDLRIEEKYVPIDPSLLGIMEQKRK